MVLLKLLHTSSQRNCRMWKIKLKVPLAMKLFLNKVYKFVVYKLSWSRNHPRSLLPNPSQPTTNLMRTSWETDGSTTSPVNHTLIKRTHCCRKVQKFCCISYPLPINYINASKDICDSIGVNKLLGKTDFTEYYSKVNNVLSICDQAHSNTSSDDKRGKESTVRS